MTHFTVRAPQHAASLSFGLLLKAGLVLLQKFVFASPKRRCWGPDCLHQAHSGGFPMRFSPKEP